MNLFENMGNVNRADEVKPLITKWSKTGLMEGLKGGNEKSTVAVLLENQARQLIKEGSAEMSGTSGAGFEQWHGVALPLVRRIFAEIAAKEFVSVQPMNLPSGLVFYLDFKYANSKQPFGFAPQGQNQTGTLQGITNAAGNPTDGLYGAGRFGYRKLTFSGFFTGAGTTADAYAVRGFIPASGSTPVTLTAGTTYFPAFTVKSGNDLVMIISASVAGSGSTQTYAVSYSIQPTNDARSDFETANGRSLDTNLNIPEIELQMRSIPVTAKTRKLKASWTPEFAQDLNAYHSVDAEGIHQ